jgi:hypothetical protein
MDAIINTRSFASNKKIYYKPAIIQELLLEAKAGSVIEPGRTLQEPSPIISPGDYSINNEP